MTCSASVPDRAVADDTPFYLYMSHYAIHAPWEKDGRFHQKYLDAGLKGLVAEMVLGYDAHGLFDRQAVKALLSTGGRWRDVSRITWTLLMFNLWHDRWIA